MSRHGFSLVEVLVCVAIAAILVAILMPVYSSAKRSSYETVCLSNLRQLHAAVRVYREQYEGQGQYGDMYTRGPPLAPLSKSLCYDPGLTACKGEGNPVSVPGGFSCFFIPSPPDRRSGFVSRQEYASAEQGNAVLIMDLNRNRVLATRIGLGHGGNLTVEGIAVLLGGQIVRKVKAGDPWRFDWWK